MKTGDLVLDLSENGPAGEAKAGIILTWVTMGGVTPTVWDVLFPDGCELRSEDELEVISESR